MLTKHIVFLFFGFFLGKKNYNLFMFVVPKQFVVCQGQTSFCVENCQPNPTECSTILKQRRLVKSGWPFVKFLPNNSKLVLQPIWNVALSWKRLRSFESVCQPIPTGFSDQFEAEALGWKQLATFEGFLPTIFEPSAPTYLNWRHSVKNSWWL